MSWKLMIGKNPLWVAKQHGYSIETMVRDLAVAHAAKIYAVE